MENFKPFLGQVFGRSSRVSSKWYHYHQQSFKVVDIGLLQKNCNLKKLKDLLDRRTAKMPYIPLLARV